LEKEEGLAELKRPTGVADTTSPVNQMRDTRERVVLEGTSNVARISDWYGLSSIRRKTVSLAVDFLI
jgi:hypothetical protein